MVKLLLVRAGSNRVVYDVGGGDLIALVKYLYI